MGDKSEYYNRIYEASGEEVLGVLTSADRRVIASQKDGDIRLFLEDPKSRLCFLETEIDTE